MGAQHGPGHTGRSWPLSGGSAPRTARWDLPPPAEEPPGIKIRIKIRGGGGVGAAPQPWLPKGRPQRRRAARQPRGCRGSGPGAAAGWQGGRAELTSRNLFHCPTSLSYWEMVVSHCLSSRKLPLSGLPPAAAAASAGLHQAAAHTHTKAATLSIWARGDTRRGGGVPTPEPNPSRALPAGDRDDRPTDRPTERGKGRGRQGRGGGGCPARHLAASPATALLAAAGKAARSLPARAAVCSRPPRAPRPALRPPLAPPRPAPPPPRSAPLPSARHR